MYRKVEDFLKAYEQEAAGTQKMLDALTDASLATRVADGHRTLGNIAWHIALTLPEMMGHTGLEVAGPDPKTPTPATAREIADTYRSASQSLLKQVREKWDDATLEVVDEMYGEKWARGFSLAGLLAHEIHHRGQMSVVMRQAGLPVPGVYGPSKEEWVKYGMEAPPE